MAYSEGSKAAHAAPPPETASTGGVPLQLVAQCARKALDTVLAACDDGHDGVSAVALGLAASLVDKEALPQAWRWHRRDLAPALAAAWHAVHRALGRCGCAAGGRHQLGLEQPPVAAGGAADPSGSAGANACAMRKSQSWCQ